MVCLLSLFLPVQARVSVDQRGKRFHKVKIDAVDFFSPLMSHAMDLW